jgi:hypothetical protein
LKWERIRADVTLGRMFVAKSPALALIEFVHWSHRHLVWCRVILRL